MGEANDGVGRVCPRKRIEDGSSENTGCSLGRKQGYEVDGARIFCGPPVTMTFIPLQITPIDRWISTTDCVNSHTVIKTIVSAVSLQIQPQLD
jgi:hypothetical protein